MVNNISGVERLPIPEEKAIGDGRLIRTWQVTMKDLPADVQLLTELHSLDKILSVSIEHAKRTDLVLIVVRGQGTSYMDGYLAAWFAFRRLEEMAGPIGFIQGLPRECWKVEFLAVENA
jgi:hypothetical protein